MNGVIIVVFYVLVAAASVFGLCLGHSKVAEFSEYVDFYGYTAPVLCGVFWPFAAPIYAAYLAFHLYTRK